MTAPTAILDPSVLEGYLTDASNVKGTAEALFRPRSAEEVAEILREAQRTGTAVTVSAGRTSTTAGAVPFGGWILSMEQLKRVHFIDHDLAKADAGVILGEFQREIEATGRLFPPDPTSKNDSTLGAAIACNASGARSFRYGPTRPWIEALTVVLPTGEILEVKRGDPIPADWPLPRWEEPHVKTAAGYRAPESLLDLFIGQEGTLGVVVDATVRLTELPKAMFALVAWFPDRLSCTRFVARAREASRREPRGALSPRCLEYFDHHCLDLARARFGGVPDGAHDAVYSEQEVLDEVGEDGHLAAWLEALSEAGGLADDTLLATDQPTQQMLLSFRHSIPAGINEEVVRNGMPKVGTDLAVPDAHLDEIMTAYEQSPLKHVLFGHIGDNHLHLNLLPRTEAELATARAFYDDLARQAVALGGTVSAEHGIGRLKKKHLAMMLEPALIDAFRRLKHHLDPGGVLGRGILFDL